MKTQRFLGNTLLSLAVTFGAGMAGLSPFHQAYGQVSGHTMGEFTNIPILSTDQSGVTPLVMINTSNDHQLYFKAYNDYTNLDNDPALEVTYKHSVDYYGYFDSYKCYTYNNNRFEPASLTGDKKCTSAWSGNFLNWATMARIDAIRKILFGGHRRVDSGSETVLERTYLPNDAHSWAKYYDGSGGAAISEVTPFNPANGITLCNTTVNTTGAVSEDVTDPPQIKVARGNYALWASNERWQCRWNENVPNTGQASRGQNGNNPTLSGLDAAGDSPLLAAGLGAKDYVARVQACVTNLQGRERCKKYPNGNYKPIGLLQIYGADDKLHFGMVGGSYSKNKSGGILIKDIGSITDEIDPNDGSFTKVSIDAADGGIASNQSEGIVNTWSMWRIIKYKHSDGTYGTSGLNKNNCTWGEDYFSDGQCMNWGNPYAEIYLNSLRYLAGEPVSGTFRANDSNEIPGLNTPQTWNDPLSDANYCAKLNIINFNSSVISYDADNLDDISDGIESLGASANSENLTNAVGAGEGIHGNPHFVGETGTDNNQLCTAKTVNKLGKVKGTCAEAPRLEGSYRIAGLTHWAHFNDIRPASAGPRALPDDQIVDTYSVALASATPQVNIPVPGKTNQFVNLLPACRNTGSNGNELLGNCTIVDFKVVEPHTESGGTGTGKFYVNWEDSEQGGDFDQDMWGVIEYSINATEITVTTDAIQESTPYHMGFGYVLGGTTRDGFHVHSGIHDFDYTDLSTDSIDPTAPPLTGCVNCRSQSEGSPTGPTSNVYTIGTSTASLLNDPLWYASKWGGFEDIDGDGTPNLQEEWDVRNLDFVRVPDGIPDTFFYATNPAALERALIKVFDDILAKTASGTAAAVVANSRQGRGALYQAMYDTRRTDANNNTVEWFGNLHAFWVDAYGFVREDKNGNDRMDSYIVDPVIDIFYDENTRKPRLRRYTSSSATTFSPSGSTLHPLTDVKSIWDARDRLAAITDATTQRAYSSVDNDRRYIFTWMDTDHQGDVDGSEVIPFTSTAVDNTNFGWFDVADEATADTIVNFARGEEIAGLRNRTMDVDGDGNTEVMRLGDIVHATPTVVGAPAEAFDLLYSDDGYLDFRRQYHNRRQVVYIGANDGLLHAFNGGFFDNTGGVTSILKKPAGSSYAAHEIGQELWAYAPMNLLSHIKWLVDPDYTHVYYMDAKPRVFDAKIFTADADHPHGWGTVLVAGMRFGGGAMTIDTGADGLGDADPTDDRTLRSAYVVMDITNPEVAPKLIAELTHPELGYTTSYPTAFAVVDDSNNINKWYLVFGSGPTSLGALGTSTQNAKLFVYDLNTKSFATGYNPYDLGLANSFTGDPVSVDWDIDFKAEALYFGTAGGTAAAGTGKVFKFSINEQSLPGSWTAPTVFFDPGRPMTITPSVTWDHRFKHWVYFATGRLWVKDDLLNIEQQRIYGMLDIADLNPAGTLPVTVGNLLDVSAAKVYSNGDVTGVAGAGVFDDLEVLIDGGTTTLNVASTGMDGWYKDLVHDGVDPSERVINPQALLGQVLFTPAYQPGNHICNALGNSSLYGFYYRTGTGADDPTIFGIDSSDTRTTNGVVGYRSVDSVSLGVGLGSSPSLHTGEGSGVDDSHDDDITVITQTGVAAIDLQQAKSLAPVRSGEMSWREPLNSLIELP